MGDFHEYYSGARRAPYLTIFIGGNHEASNYLFELYYGGWVAPNIYYLGAANVLRIGPLRIAGLSGIWKHYDYRKEHFERLPYNSAEYYGIYHVRELDVRKLLSIRSQVDIGLSHDWPRTVELKGDHRELFRRKDRFENDSKEGKLGSAAAKACLERLRPMYWFSAHLHIKYPAIIEHGEPGQEQSAQRGESEDDIWAVKKIDGAGAGPSKSANAKENKGRNENGHQQPKNKSPEPKRHQPLPLAQDRVQVSAWNTFQVDVEQEDAQERDRMMQERQDRLAEEARTGQRAKVQYTFEETFKQVTSDGLDRTLQSVTSSAKGHDDETEPEAIMQLDGCGQSKLKRRHESSSPDQSGTTTNGHQADLDPIRPSLDAPSNFDGEGGSSTAVGSSHGDNPDAIDIDFSDSEPETAPEMKQHSIDEADIGLNGKEQPNTAKQPEAGTESVTAARSAHKPDPIELPRQSTSTTDMPSSRTLPKSILSDSSEDGGVALNPSASAFKPARISNIATVMERSSSVRSSLSAEAVPFVPQPSAETNSLETSEARAAPKPDDTGDVVMVDNEITPEMRAQLEQLSSSFAPAKPFEKSADLPFPEAITNKTTKFLALDKCERFRDFLQLLEIETDTNGAGDNNASIVRPLKLQYDPEWLAIVRVFAPELNLPTLPESRSYDVPAHKGETHYRERILDEEKWIDEHVTSKDLLTIPKNFVITAPVYDPSQEVDSNDMPREYPNPQTAQFCELIGIENKFALSEEDQEARIAKGPNPEEDRSKFQQRGGRGGGGRGGRGRGGGFGGRGTFRGGRGGRGGRGRGGW